MEKAEVTSIANCLPCSTVMGWDFVEFIATGCLGVSAKIEYWELEIDYTEYSACRGRRE